MKNIDMIRVPLFEYARQTDSEGRDESKQMNDNDWPPDEQIEMRDVSMCIDVSTHIDVSTKRTCMTDIDNVPRTAAKYIYVSSECTRHDRRQFNYMITSYFNMKTSISRSMIKIIRALKHTQAEYVTNAELLQLINRKWSIDERQAKMRQIVRRIAYSCSCETCMRLRCYLNGTLPERDRRDDERDRRGDESRVEIV